MSASTDMTESAYATAPAQPPLRERKYARTKIALLEAMLERLRQKPLADITVRDLCDDAGISEATFFNYFKKKDDLLRYFIQVWALEVTVVANERAGADGGVGYIEAVFEDTGERIADNTRVMLEIISHMAHAQPEEWNCERPLLGAAERIQAFPGVEGVLQLEECEIDVMFRAAVERAKTRGEISEHVDSDAAVTSILAIFLGIPLWHATRDPKSVRLHYATALDTLWAGLRATLGNARSGALT